MTDLWKETVTVYNSIPATGDTPRSFGHFVLKRCFVKIRLTSGGTETIEKKITAESVRTKDISAYLSPAEYYALPENQRVGRYTAQVGDFVVLGEVRDTVGTAAEFLELQKKYASSGFRITSVAVNIHGMNTDHIAMA